MDRDLKSSFALRGGDAYTTPLVFPASSTTHGGGGTSATLDHENAYESVFLDRQTLVPLPSDFSISTSPFLSDYHHKTTISPPAFSLFAEDVTFMDNDSSASQHQLLIPPLDTLKTPKKETAYFLDQDSTFTRTTTIELTQPLDFFPINSYLPQSHLPSLNESPNSFDSVFFTNLDSNYTHNSQTLNCVAEGFNLNYNNGSPQTLNSVAEGFNVLSSNASTSNGKNKKKDTEKQRCRQKMSDKYRSLHKLMPWDKKVDTSTMLAEAYNYIKFLQAQVNALQTMPFECDSSTPNLNSDGYVCPLGSMFGVMGMLTRQQLLKVLLNAPEAQTRLYSQGCCVFSIEQLAALKKLSEARAAASRHQLIMFN